MKSNTLYVRFTDEAHRDSLVTDYEAMGYFVSVEDNRLRVSSKPLPKVSPKKRFDRGRNKK